MTADSYDIGQKVMLNLSIRSAAAAARAGLFSRAELDGCISDLTAWADQLGKESGYDDPESPLRRTIDELRQSPVRDAGPTVARYT